MNAATYSLEETTAALVPSHALIRHPKERHHILGILATLYNVPRITNFPGGHPISVTEADLPRIHSGECLVALKTDGVRYLCLLCAIDGAFRAVMIDRCLRMYEVVVFAPEGFYEQPTLMDGELILDHQTNRLCYQAFDVVAMLGKRFHAERYCDRLQAVHTHVLSDLPEGMNEDGEEAESHILEENKIYAAQKNHMRLTIVPKRFVHLKDGQRLWEDRNKYPFPTDGLVLNMDRSPIQTGTLRTVFKWKPHNAIDLGIRSETLEVFCRNAGCEEPMAKLSIAGVTHAVVLQENHLVQWLRHRRKDRSSWLLECLANVRDGQVLLWPMKERIDKLEPNDLRVIERTLEAIPKGVSLEQIFLSGQTMAIEDPSPSSSDPASNCNARRSQDTARPPTPPPTPLPVDEASTPRGRRGLPSTVAKRPAEHHGLPRQPPPRSSKRTRRATSSLRGGPESPPLDTGRIA